jgi:hypothetical protein
MVFYNRSIFDKGMMEWWNNGIMAPIAFQLSSIPIFQYSSLEMYPMKFIFHHSNCEPHPVKTVSCPLQH